MKSNRDSRARSLKPTERSSSGRLSRLKLSSDLSNFNKSEIPAGSVTARARPSDCYDYRSRSNSPCYTFASNTLRESNVFNTFTEGVGMNATISKISNKNSTKNYVPCLSNRNRPASSLNTKDQLASKKVKQPEKPSKVSKENVSLNSTASSKPKESKQVVRRRREILKSSKVSPMRDIKPKPQISHSKKENSLKATTQNSKKIRSALIIREQELKQALEESRSKDNSMESEQGIESQGIDSSFTRGSKPLDITFTHMYRDVDKPKDVRRSNSLDRKVRVRSLKNSVLARLAFRELHKTTLDSLISQKSPNSGELESKKSPEGVDSCFLERLDPSPDFGKPDRSLEDKKFTLDSESLHREPLSFTNLLNSSGENKVISPSSEFLSEKQSDSEHIPNIPQGSPSLKDRIRNKQLTLSIPDELTILKPIQISLSESPEQTHMESSISVEGVELVVGSSDSSISAPALRHIKNISSSQVVDKESLLKSTTSICENPCIHTSESEDIEENSGQTMALDILKRAFCEAEEARRVLEESQDTINRSLDRNSSNESRCDYEDFLKIQSIVQSSQQKILTPDIYGASFESCTPDSMKFVFTEESNSLDKAVQTDTNMQEELLFKILKTLGKDNVLKGFKLLGGFARYLESQGDLML
jgi:hypothetical protein